MPPSKTTHQTNSTLAKRLILDGPQKVQHTSRRVRAWYNNKLVIDTIEALLVWEHDYYPQYYIPAKGGFKWDDFFGQLPEQCEEVELTESDDWKAGFRAAIKSWNLGEGLDMSVLAIYWHEHVLGAGVRPGHVRVPFERMDRWLEEDTPIYIHPKDPFKRIDCLHSSRPITISLNGQILARATNSVHLLETSLPTRYYLPIASVDPNILRKSDLVTKCPYKGDAEYYHVSMANGEVHENLIWYYRHPTYESGPISGLLCFYNEKVDVELDGKKLSRPNTKFA